MSGWQNQVGKTDQMFLEIMFARRLRGYDESHQSGPGVVDIFSVLSPSSGRRLSLLQILPL